MKIIQTPSGDVVAVLSVWELQVVATGVEGVRSSLDVESAMVSSMALMLEETVRLTPVEPHICGDLHPAEDCGLGDDG